MSCLGLVLGRCWKDNLLTMKFVANKCKSVFPLSFRNCPDLIYMSQLSPVPRHFFPSLNANTTLSLKCAPMTRSSKPFLCGLRHTPKCCRRTWACFPHPPLMSTTEFTRFHKLLWFHRKYISMLYIKLYRSLTSSFNISGLTGCFQMDERTSTTNGKFFNSSFQTLL